MSEVLKLFVENPWTYIFISWGLSVAISVVYRTVRNCKAQGCMHDLHIANLKIANLEQQLDMLKQARYANDFTQSRQARAREDAMRREQENVRRRYEEAQRQYGFGRGFANAGMGSGFQQGGFNQQSRPKETLAEIKAIYRKAIKENHPDTVKANGGSDAEVKQATIKTQQLNEQYAKDKKRFK